MICPICGCATTVLQTWENDKFEYKRRRECLDCGHRYTTIEMVIEKPKEEMRPDETGEPAVQQRPSKPKKVQPYGLSDLHIAMRAGKEMASAAGS